jgi:outer membrane protein TolC
MAALDWLAADEQATQVWWDLRAEVSRAFYRVFEAERQIRVQELARQLLAEASTIAEARYASGAGRQTDVLRASVAVARTESELRRLDALRQAAAAQLNGLLDRPFDQEIPPVQVHRLPFFSVPVDSIRAWGRESQPAMRIALLGVERSQTGVDLAHSEIWPDLQLSLQYGTRDRTGGREHMGGAAVGFTLPLFAGRKQYALRDEAQAGAAQAGARLREMEASLDAGIGTLLSDVERTADLVILFQQEILPQARATTESALSSYRSGSVDFLTLLDAELALVRFEGELFTLLAEYGTALASLEAWVGRELPPSEASLWETP